MNTFFMILFLSFSEINFYLLFHSDMILKVLSVYPLGILNPIHGPIDQKYINNNINVLFRFSL